MLAWIVLRAVRAAANGRRSGAQQTAALIVLFVGSLSIIAPVGVYLGMGDKAGHVLDGWKTWLAANNATAMVVLFLVFGVSLVGKRICGLS